MDLFFIRKPKDNWLVEHIRDNKILLNAIQLFTGLYRPDYELEIDKEIVIQVQEYLQEKAREIDKDSEDYDLYKEAIEALNYIENNFDFEKSYLNFSYLY